MKKRDKKPTLVQLWARMPKVECRGLCHAACTIIPLEDSENNLIWEREGFNLSGRIQAAVTREAIKPQDEDLKVVPCPALDQKTKLCTIYENRPIICRAFGAMKAGSIRCPHGCKSERWFDAMELTEIFKAARAL